MKIELSNIYRTLYRAMMREDGQDVVQVGLIVALVAVGATAGLNSVATAVGGAFNTIGSFVAHMSGMVIN